MCLSRKEMEASRTIWFCPPPDRGTMSMEKILSTSAMPSHAEGNHLRETGARNCLRVEGPGAWDQSGQDGLSLARHLPGEMAWPEELEATGEAAPVRKPHHEDLLVANCTPELPDVCDWGCHRQSLKDILPPLTCSADPALSYFPSFQKKKKKRLSFISFLSVVFRFLYPPWPLLPTPTQQ